MAQPWRRRLTVVAGAAAGPRPGRRRGGRRGALVAGPAPHRPRARAGLRAPGHRALLVDRLGRPCAASSAPTSTTGRRPTRSRRSSPTASTPTSPPARRWSTPPRCCSTAYGFSPADVDWELLAQSTAGSVLVVGLPDGLDVDDLGDGFEELGYERPDDDDGVWNGGEELVARISPATAAALSPQFQYLALDADRHLLLASDSGPYLRDAVGERRRRPRRRGPARRRARGGRAALGRRLHRRLRLPVPGHGPGRRDDQSHGRPAGRAGRGRRPDGRLRDGRRAATGTVRVAMAFETDDQARRNADSRASSRPARRPGRAATSPTGSRLGPVTADGRWCGWSSSRSTTARCSPTSRPGRCSSRPADGRDGAPTASPSRSRCTPAHGLCMGQRYPVPPPRPASPSGDLTECGDPRPDGWLSGTSAAAGCWLTTNTEDSAMAAPAIIGVSSPAAASGSAATL